MIGFECQDIIGFFGDNLVGNRGLGAHGMIAPVRSNNSNKAGIAVILFDLSSTFSCANTLSLVAGPGTNDMQC